MRVRLDAAGRVVIPEELRNELRLRAGSELELTVRDGRIELRAPSRVEFEREGHGA